MSHMPLHLRRHPSCDCGACCDVCGDHLPGCMSGLGDPEEELDIAEEVALSDGYMYPPRHGKTTIRLPGVDEIPEQI